ncbi:MAG: phosphotransferase [Dehalococcoidia bacterium]
MIIDTLISGFQVMRETGTILADTLVSRLDNSIPRNGSAVTAEWLTGVFKSYGRDIRVESVELLNEVTGTTTHARFALKYNEAGVKAGLPGLLFAKLQPREIPTRIFVSRFDLIRNEARFYSQISRELHPLVPRFYFSESKKRGARFVLLFEDLKSGNLRFKDVTEPYTVEEAELVLRALAGIHAKFWQSPRFNKDLNWLLSYEKDRNVRINRLMRQWALKRSLRRFADIIPEPVMNAARLVEKEYEAFERTWSELPETLIHGDPHPGNLYFGENRVGLLDWQVVRRGPAMRDVTYFLLFSMSLRDRHAYQERLIQTYLQSLTDFGVKELTFDKAWEQFRLCAPYAWIAAIVTAAAATLQGETQMRKGIEHAGSAIVELDSVGALHSITR